MIDQYPHGFKVFIDGKQFRQDRIERVDFEDGLDMLDELTITINNPDMTYTKGRNQLRGKKITLEAGRHGLFWDEIFIGKISKPISSGDRKANHKIILKALPVDLTEGWHTKRYQFFRDYTRFSDIILDVAKKMHSGYRIQIEQSPVVGAILPIQQGETDIQFCKRIALECGGWEFSIKGRTVIFRQAKPVQKSSFVFEYGLNIHRYEEIESDDEVAKGGSVIAETNQNSIKTESITASVDQARKENATKTDDPGRTNDSSANTVFDPASDGAIAQAKAKGMAKKPAISERILSITGPADIRCRAGRTATVKGLGELDGKFYIQMVNYKWSKADTGVMTVRMSNKQGQ